MLEELLDNLPPDMGADISRLKVSIVKVSIYGPGRQPHFVLNGILSMPKLSLIIRHSCGASFSIGIDGFISIPS